MASISNRPNGRKWVQFRGPDGKRHTIRMGKASQREAKAFAFRIEALVAARALGQPPDVQTSQWVAGLLPEVRNRLAACGLTSRVTASTVGELADAFLQSLDCKDSTRGTIQRTVENLRTHFGAHRLLSTITAADAQEFRTWLRQDGHERGGPLSTATVSRRVRRAKQVFQHALDRRWIDQSPFAGMSGWNEVNRSRDHFVDRRAIAAILEASPDAEFRAMLAIARFCGLRCPSELRPLEWPQVNWANDTIVVRSSKTERHEGHDQRITPLFEPAKTHLRELWEMAEPGETLCFPGHQVTGAALAKQLRTTCTLANVEPWAKPWQNIRSSCESELLYEHPIHVVAQWLGHSPEVALKHYAQIVKERTARDASKPDAKTDARDVRAT